MPPNNYSRTTEELDMSAHCLATFLYNFFNGSCPQRHIYGFPAFWLANGKKIHLNQNYENLTNPEN